MRYWRDEYRALTALDPGEIAWLDVYSASPSWTRKYAPGLLSRRPQEQERMRRWDVMSLRSKSSLVIASLCSSASLHASAGVP